MAMVRARNSLHLVAMGRFRAIGSRFLGAATQPIEADDPGTDFPELDEAGIGRLVMALNAKPQNEGLGEEMHSWKGLVGHQSLAKILEQVGSSRTALGFFQWAQEQENFNRHRIGSYWALLKKLLDDHMGKDIRRVMREMHGNGYILKKSSYFQIVSQLVDSPEDVIGIVQDMIEQRYGNFHVLKEIVKICHESGNLELVCGIIELVSGQEGFFLDRELLSKITLEIVEKGDKGALEKVLKSYLDYNKVIDYLVKEEKLEQACEMHDRMLEAGISPTPFTYGRLVDGLVKASKFPEALLLLDLMAEYGVVPSSITYNHLLDGLCKAGKVKAAFKLFKVMVKNGVTPTSYTYNTLINGLCLQGQISKARKELEKMVESGFVPDVVTYTVLINQLRKDGNLKEALELYEEMLSKGLRPDKPTYMCIISGLCKEGSLDKLTKFLSKYKSSINFDTYAYEMLISTYGKYGKLKETKDLFEDMKSKGIPQTLIMFNSLMSALCHHKLVDEAFEVYHKLMKKGFVPDRYTYTILIGGLCNMGRTEEACALKDTMIQKKCTPDRMTYGVLVAGLTRAARYNEAEEMRKQMELAR